MAISRVKSWANGEVLTANDLNNEFNNITNNALIEPIVLTQQFDANGQLVILDADADTLLDASTDDTIDVTIANADDFRFTANTFQALSGSSIEVVNGGLTVTAGTLAVTDGQTTLADPDSRTNTVATPLTVAASTSGTAAAGIGTGIKFTAKSADENPSEFGQVEFAASDVTAASEDSYFQVLLRVAGAALAACYRFVATTTNKAIFTHTNSADRTYTLPDVSGTVVLVGAGNCDTTALKTATASATLSRTANAGESFNDSSNVVGHDYQFAPTIRWTQAPFGSNSDTSASATDAITEIADPGTTVWRRTLNLATNGGTGPGGSGISATITARWRYVTASDMPEMWVAYDPVTGDVRATWAADDPAPNGEPGVIVENCTSIRLTAQDLEHFAELNAKASDAQAWIRERKLRMQHQAYRALQLLTGDDAPSKWLLDSCEIRNGKLEMKPPVLRNP